MSWILVTLWGGIVGVDATSVVQSMISRPLVAGTVTGLLLGRPTEGLAIGILLEIFALVILPVGASRYPESGTATVAAAAALMLGSEAGLEVTLLLLALAFGLLWERVGGTTVEMLRRLNERLIGDGFDRQVRDGRRLERRHLTALCLDFLRACAVTLSGAAIGLLLLHALGPLWSLSPVATRGGLGVAITGMLAGALGLFGGWGERRLVFVFGIFCGLILLLAR